MDTVTANVTTCTVAKSRSQKFSVGRYSASNRPAYSIKSISDIKDGEIPELQELKAGAQDDLKAAQEQNDEDGIKTAQEKINKLQEGIDGWQKIVDYINDMETQAATGKLTGVGNRMPDMLVNRMADRLFGPELRDVQNQLQQLRDAEGKAKAEELRYCDPRTYGNPTCKKAQADKAFWRTMVVNYENKEANLKSQMFQASLAVNLANTISFTGRKAEKRMKLVDHTQITFLSTLFHFSSSQVGAMLTPTLRHWRRRRLSPVAKRLVALGLFVCSFGERTRTGRGAQFHSFCFRFCHPAAGGFEVSFEVFGVGLGVSQMFGGGGGEEKETAETIGSATGETRGFTLMDPDGGDQFDVA